MHIAAMNGNYKLIYILLYYGANINARDYHGSVPLHFAAASKEASKETLELLLRNGAKLDSYNNDGWTALSYAAQAKNEQTVLTLLERGSKPNGAVIATQAPLYIAVLEGFMEAANHLLNFGADPNTAGKGGYSALHVAC